jgi:hypothetical protein
VGEFKEPIWDHRRLHVHTLCFETTSWNPRSSPTCDLCEDDDDVQVEQHDIFHCTHIHTVSLRRRYESLLSGKTHLTFLHFCTRTTTNSIFYMKSDELNVKDVLIVNDCERWTDCESFMSRLAVARFDWRTFLVNLVAWGTWVVSIQSGRRSTCKSKSFFVQCSALFATTTPLCQHICYPYHVESYPYHVMNYWVTPATLWVMSDDIWWGRRTALRANVSISFFLIDAGSVLLLA